MPNESYEERKIQAQANELITETERQLAKVAIYKDSGLAQLERCANGKV